MFKYRLQEINSRRRAGLYSMAGVVIFKPELIWNGARFPPAASQHNILINALSEVIEEEYKFSIFVVELGD